SVFDEDNRKLLDAAIRTGAPAVQEYIEAESTTRFGKSSAFDMIKNLSSLAKTGNGVLDTVSDQQTGEQLPLADYILKIFMQHQEDMRGAPLNERFRFMPELHEICEQIATEINDNLLDPIALVSLVGNRTVLDEHLRVAGPDKV